jgi:Flp pilus assembly pilin Flp
VEKMFRRFRKGQSTAEYAIVIGLVIAAAVAMQVYVKRGIQAKMKDASDYNDPAASMLTTKQYEPDYMTTQNMVSTRNSTETTDTLKGGGVVRAIDGADVSSRTGTTTILGTQ